MANVHDFLEMLEGSQNLCAMQKESHVEHKEMTVVGYIADSKEIIKALW